jgi:hypothetical protein
MGSYAAVDMGEVKASVKGMVASCHCPCMGVKEKDGGATFQV